jgi:hypothetical protein
VNDLFEVRSAVGGVQTRLSYAIFYSRSGATAIERKSQISNGDSTAL